MDSEKRGIVGFTDKDGENAYTISEGISFLMSDILQDLSNKERIEVITQKCNILDSLSNALTAVKM